MSRRLFDLTGQRFGRLLVLERGENSRRGVARWVCRCDCGGTSIVQRDNLRGGHTTSCGCLHDESARGNEHGLVHGHARDLLKTTEYRAWERMIQRCHNPKHRRFKDYGGRGITVCGAWRASFQAFLDDMGLKPSPDLSLDRIDNGLGYFPENCRWATHLQQAANRRPPQRRDQ